METLDVVTKYIDSQEVLFTALTLVLTYNPVPY